MLEVSEFRLEEAPERDLVEFHAMFAATYVADRPSEPVPTLAAALGYIRTPLFNGSTDCLHWAARLDGRLDGFAKVGLPAPENSHLAFIQIRVHPERRRQGLGVALLRRAAQAIHARGRPFINAWGVTAGSAAEAWGTGLGAKVAHRDVLQILDLESTSRSRWDVATPQGYSLVSWIGAAPGQLVEAFAQARNAMHDAPTHESSSRFPVWTVQRVRQDEQAEIGAGTERRVVAAVADDSREIAGLTILDLRPHRPEDAFQRDTAVLARHRGRGLGLAMKAAMLRWLTAHRPVVRRVGTATAEDNVHMIRVNTQLGFQTRRTMVDLEIATGQLLARLTPAT